MRVPLKNGNKIISDKEYRIDAVVGTGANCIVYDAHFRDSMGNRKSIRLKECFPADCDAVRDGMNVSWPDDRTRNNAFIRFDKSYSLSSCIQNEETLALSGVYTLELFESNNTKYIAIIPNSGKSYDKNISDDVVDAVKTALALAKVIHAYHEKGYLHLDIKPENFVAVDDSSGLGKNIILFDNDTITCLDDIQDGNVKAVSFSKGWAAPELEQMRLSKLCPATDIFSIGAILFEKIMLRPVSAEDMSVISSWEFDERISSRNINPKVSYLITEIFHKTLSANINRRYSSADQLVAALNLLLKTLSSDAPFIISEIPQIKSQCVGRTKELKELKELLNSYKTVLIAGPHGIGKSTLANAYIDENLNSYDAIVFLRFAAGDNLFNLIQTINVSNLDASVDKYDAIKSICATDNVLIVLDNYDVETKDFSSLKCITDLGCSLIITSCTQISTEFLDIKRIELNGLNDDDLIYIFESETGIALSDDEKYSLICSEFFSYATECTFFWKLFIGLVKFRGISIEEVVSLKFYTSNILNANDKVLSNKDGIISSDTIKNSLIKLFRLGNLNDRELEMLHSIYFLQSLPLTKKAIRDLAKLDDTVDATECLEQIDMLIQLGYVEESRYDHSLVIYDLLEEIIFNDESLDITNSQLVMSLMNSDFLIRDYDNPAWESYELEDAKYKSYFDCLLAIIFKANMRLENSREFFTNCLFYESYSFLKDRGYLLKFIDEKYLEYTFTLLKLIGKNKKDNMLIRIKAYTALSILGIAYIPNGFMNELEEKNYKAAATVEHYFFMAAELYETYSNHHVVDAEILDIICEPIVFLATANAEFKNALSVESIEKVLKLAPTAVTNRANFPSELFEISILGNVKYQKHYLTEIEKSAGLLPEVERNKLYFKAVGRILCLGKTPQFHKMDLEHFELLKKMYVPNAELFRDINSLRLSDFVEDVSEQYEIPNQILYNGLTTFQMAFDPENGHPDKSIFDKKEATPQDLELELINELNEFVDSLNDNHSSIELYQLLYSCVLRIDILIHSSIENKNLILENIYDGLKLQKQNFSVPTAPIHMRYIGNKTRSLILLSMILIDCSFNNIAQVDKLYTEYLNTLNLDQIFNEYNPTLMADFLSMTINAVYDFIGIRTALEYLERYIILAERVVENNDKISSDLLYNLYDYMLDLINSAEEEKFSPTPESILHAIFAPRDDDPSDRYDSLNEAHGTEASESIRLYHFIHELKNKYGLKEKQLTGIRFDPNEQY